ncbi:LppX_LprAFG lipoprotein [Streptomyces racemochromogenes]|uniref:LppX_LprAFG lipoprotein n=1 Tax=Streptomyces racemochromogenes TaxID=67353 RepID=A0ABW7PHX0_9ACTN
MIDHTRGGDSMLVHRKNTAMAALAGVLLVGGATTACEGGKKDDGGKAAAATPSAAAPAAGKPARGAADATPATYLEKAKKKSEEITSLRYTMTGTAQGRPVNADVSLRIKPSVAMSMKMTAQGEAAGVDLRLVDGVMYMGSEGAYLKIDVKSANPDAAKQLDGLGAGSANAGENPGDRAGDLLGAKDLKTVGEETIDGVRTRHVSGTVTVEQMRASLATLAPEARERQEKSIRKLEGEGIKSMNMDMWIDEGDHTKQVRTRAEATKGPMDMTMKFLDYNQPVDIAAPPADQVVDLGAKGSDQG